MTPAEVIQTILARMDATLGSRADLFGRAYNVFKPEVHKIVREAIEPLAGAMAKLSNWASPLRTEALRSVASALAEAVRMSPVHPLAPEWRKMAADAYAELAAREGEKRP